MIRISARRFCQSKTANLPKIFALKHSQPRLNIDPGFFKTLDSREQIDSVIRQLCEINDTQNLNLAADNITPETFIGALMNNMELIHRSEQLLDYMVDQSIRLLISPEVPMKCKSQMLNAVICDGILRNKLFSESVWIDKLTEFIIEHPKEMTLAQNLLSESQILIGLETKNLTRYLDYLWMRGLEEKLSDIDISYFQSIYPSHQLSLMLIDKHGVLELNDYLSFLAALGSRGFHNKYQEYLRQIQDDFGNKFIRNLENLAKRNSKLNKYYCDTLFRLCLLCPSLKQQVVKQEILALMNSIPDQSIMRYAQMSFCLDEPLKVPDIPLTSQYTRNFCEFEAVFELIDFDFITSRSGTILDLMEFSLANTAKFAEFIIKRTEKIDRIQSSALIQAAFKKISIQSLLESENPLKNNIQKMGSLLADLASRQSNISTSDFTMPESLSIDKKITYINSFIQNKL